MHSDNNEAGDTNVSGINIVYHQYQNQKYHAIVLLTERLSIIYSGDWYQMLLMITINNQCSITEYFYNS